jgi:glucokinase
MSIVAIDLGGTKVASALFTDSGTLLNRDSTLLKGRQRSEVSQLITDQIFQYIEKSDGDVQSVGISVPGINRSKTGTVWAPNIPGWDDYPLLEDIKRQIPGIPVYIDSDRACCILGEVWQGNAKGIDDAIFITVGTGIGAGIIMNGQIIRGAHDIAGAIGWLALQKPFEVKYTACGNFEYYASGEGIARLAKEMMGKSLKYQGVLSKNDVKAHDIFEAFNLNDPIAISVIHSCIQYWGMAAANLVSIFNPEKIIFGGGVFGPAIPFIGDIKKEAAQWAQPISMAQVRFERSALSSDAALYGAAYLTLKK